MKSYPSTLPYPFARAVQANGFLFLSGQVSMNAQGEPLPGTIEQQTQQVMENIIATLEACGSSLDKVLKVNVWLSDMAHFAAFNQCYRPYFAPDFPARTTLVSRLAFDLDIEIEVQALA
ncbi:RidA family protein [Citrobacter sp. JGM124]|nr:RidA family protein [Citrobacter sp. JGM124]